MKQNIFAVLFFVLLGLHPEAQEASALDSAMQQLAKTENPQQAVLMMNRIVKEHHLDPSKDAEILDVLYGTVAVNFALKGNESEFGEYIGMIKNKFNQTSFLNMAAAQLLNENGDARFASQISKRTLALYESFKNDTSARPKNFARQDWERFLGFAKYPYYDTHAHALFALEQYDEALKYQRMAFEGKPEDGLPSSVERYARLLQLTGKKEEAKQLLLRRASTGKLNQGMTTQLQSIYISEKGSDENLALFLDSLQKNVQATLIPELKSKMLNEPAVAFSLKDINGRTVNLLDFGGRIVVLDLWATWCRPCIASFPAMQMMVKKHPEVAFLFIAVEEKEKNPLPKVKSFIEARKYDFTVLIDEPVSPNSSSYKIISAYKPNGIPAKYIIDRKGVLRFKTSGFDSDGELMNELEAMFTILNGL